MIGFKEIEEETKTREVVQTYMFDILSDYGLTTKQIEGKIDFVTDRGTQFKAMDNIRRSNCFAHMLNNIVQAMCKDPAVAIIIKDAKSLVTYIKKTQLNIVVQSYCETRWNTVYGMLQSILNSYKGKFLIKYAREKKNNI